MHNFMLRHAVMRIRFISCLHNLIDNQIKFYFLVIFNCVDYGLATTFFHL